MKALTIPRDGKFDWSGGKISRVNVSIGGLMPGAVVSKIHGDVTLSDSSITNFALLEWTSGDITQDGATATSQILNTSYGEMYVSSDGEFSAAGRSAGTFTNHGRLDFETDGTWIGADTLFSHGRVNVRDESLVRFPYKLDMDGGLLRLDGMVSTKTLRMKGGTLTGYGTIGGDLVTSSNPSGQNPVLNPGDFDNYKREMEIVGNFTASAETTVQFAHRQDTHTRLRILGTATLAGRVTVYFGAVYSPTTPTSIDFMSAFQVTGDFQYPNFRFEGTPGNWWNADWTQLWEWDAEATPRKWKMFNKVVAS